MNKEIKERWVEALRSRHYDQGLRRLRDAEDRYCCLGVLCDIVQGTKWKLDGYLNCYGADNINSVADKDIFWVSMIPPGIQYVSELTVAEAITLAEMNDNGATFHQIADWIEVNL